MSDDGDGADGVATGVTSEHAADAHAAAAPAAAPTAASSAATAAAASASAAATAAATTSASAAAASTSVLFVADIHPAVTLQQLEDLFRTQAGFLSLRRRPHFAFVDFDTVEHATAAMEATRGHKFVQADRGLIVDWDKGRRDGRKRGGPHDGDDSTGASAGAGAGTGAGSYRAQRHHHDGGAPSWGGGGGGGGGTGVSIYASQAPLVSAPGTHTRARARAGAPARTHAGMSTTRCGFRVRAHACSHGVDARSRHCALRSHVVAFSHTRTLAQSHTNRASAHR
jgi:hypothetical protein